MLGKTKLRHMDVGRIKLVALLQSHLAAVIAITRPRNSILDEFLLLPSCDGCDRRHPKKKKSEICPSQKVGHFKAPC